MWWTKTFQSEDNYPCIGQCFRDVTPPSVLTDSFRLSPGELISVDHLTGPWAESPAVASMGTCRWQPRLPSIKLGFTTVSTYTREYWLATVFLRPTFENIHDSTPWDQRRNTLSLIHISSAIHWKRYIERYSLKTLITTIPVTCYCWSADILT